jgi:hypothetical protein
LDEKLEIDEKLLIANGQLKTTQEKLVQQEEIIAKLKVEIDKQ